MGPVGSTWQKKLALWLSGVWWVNQGGLTPQIPLHFEGMPPSFALQLLANLISPLSTEYMEPFERRDLHAFSAEPLLVYPTHYTGDPGYVSDTETSVVWDNETVKTDWDRAKSRKTQEQGELSFQAQNSDVLQSELENWSTRDEL